MAGTFHPSFISSHFISVLIFLLQTPRHYYPTLLFHLDILHHCIRYRNSQLHNSFALSFTAGTMSTLLDAERWAKRIQGYLDGGGSMDALSNFLRPRIEREPFDVMSGEEIRERLGLIRAIQERLAIFESTEDVTEPAME